MNFFRQSPLKFLIILFSLNFLNLDVAFSHFGGRSYSTWKLRNKKVEASLRIKAFLIRKMRFSEPPKRNLTESLNAYLEEKVVVTKEDELCPLFKKPFSLPLQGGDIVVSFSFQCPKRLNDTSKIKIYFNAFFPFSPQHLHFAEIDYLGKRENQYILFSKEKRAYSLQKNE
mgnify:CR=1 FL=1